LLEGTVDESNRRRRRYSLTERGRSFAPVLHALARWGLTHIDGTRPSQEVRAALARAARSRSSLKS
jgi:DNA-binding HxlR family transcriptional regulator